MIYHYIQRYMWVIYWRDFNISNDISLYPTIYVCDLLTGTYPHSVAAVGQWQCGKLATIAVLLEH